MRICLVYDCLYPYTVGGAERWYRNLAERLASAGHDVTFLTRRQWPRSAGPELPGVRVVVVSPRTELYAGGRRRILPPVLFGLGVLGHLLRRGRRYDVVHTASFPYFSVLAVGGARKRGRYRVVVDWHEVWTRAYWQEYVGRVGGWIGWRIQLACVRTQQRAFCFSRLHERRLHELGIQGELTRLEGQYAGPAAVDTPLPALPVVVFAGRHIPEKRVPAIVPAVAEARAAIPGLRAEIFGDGPERARVLEAIAAMRLDGAIAAPGFVGADVLERALASALCLVLPSSREGYGLVVLEAAARGVPVVLVAGPDNAATELVEDGVNGAIAPTPAPGDLAAAIVRIDDAGAAMRETTLGWFRANAHRLSLEQSIGGVLEAYGER